MWLLNNETACRSTLLIKLLYLHKLHTAPYKPSRLRIISWSHFVEVLQVTLPFSYGCLQLIKKWAPVSELFNSWKRRSHMRQDMVSTERVRALVFAFRLKRGGFFGTILAHNVLYSDLLLKFVSQFLCPYSAPPLPITLIPKWRSVLTRVLTIFHIFISFHRYRTAMSFVISDILSYFCKSLVPFRHTSSW
jgi:hypothetical protein